MLRHLRLRAAQTFCTAVIAALTVSACGIKGPLKPPPAAKPAQPATTIPAPAPNAPAPAQEPPPPAPPKS